MQRPNIGCIDIVIRNRVYSLCNLNHKEYTLYVILQQDMRREDQMQLYVGTTGTALITSCAMSYAVRLPT